VTFTGAVSDEELIELYRRAKVYAQLSAHEAFGVAVVESMACECIPVLSDRGSLPEVAGGEAHYVSFGSTGQSVDAIQAALSEPEGSGSTRRRRVVECYDVQRRFDTLATVLEPYASGGRA
jgi:glycosyltransferase involved in cell wall biosynthesis